MILCRLSPAHTVLATAVEKMEIPFAFLEQLVAQKVQLRRISELETQTPQQILGLNP